MLLEYATDEIASITLVVHHENANAIELGKERLGLWRRGMRRMRALRLALRRGDDEREIDGERGPASFAGALGAQTAAVKLDELLRDREPEPEAAIDSARGTVFLREPVEHLRQEGGRDPDAGIADRQLDVRVHSLQQHLDPPALERELDRIADQVRHD